MAAVAICLPSAQGALRACFYGTCSRYEVEFLPTLGFPGASSESWRRAHAGLAPALARAARTVWVLLLVFSLGFNLLEGIDHYCSGSVAGWATSSIPWDGFSDAIRQYQATCGSNPATSRATAAMATVLRQVGPVASEAIAECRTALQLNPELRAARTTTWPMRLLDSGKIGEAIEHYQEALRLRPDDSKMHFNLGNAWLKARQDADAIQEYETALRLNPGDQEAHFNLAMSS